MQTWYPPAKVNRATRDAGAMAPGYAWKLVVHTTESDRFPVAETAYFGHQSWPHFTLERDGTFWQHLPINRAARALRASPNVETNRGGAVQVECVARSSADPGAILTAAQVTALQQLYGWLRQQVPIGTAALAAGKIPGSASTSGPQRLTPGQWRTFSGVCGHRHVPSNEHWDPGAFDLARVVAGKPKPVPPPPPIEEDDMARLVRDEQGRIYKVAGNTRTYINEGATIAWLQSKGHVPVTVEDIPTAVLRDAYPIEATDPEAAIA